MCCLNIYGSRMDIICIVHPRRELSYFNSRTCTEARSSFGKPSLFLECVTLILSLPSSVPLNKTCSYCLSPPEIISEGRWLTWNTWVILKTDFLLPAKSNSSLQTENISQVVGFSPKLSWQSGLQVLTWRLPKWAGGIWCPCCAGACHRVLSVLDLPSHFPEWWKVGWEKVDSLLRAAVFFLAISHKSPQDHSPNWHYK